MAKSPKKPLTVSPPAKIEKLGAKGRQIAAIRDKFKKAMDDPEFSARMARHLRELLRQGRDS